MKGDWSNLWRARRNRVILYVPRPAKSVASTVCGISRLSGGRELAFSIKAFPLSFNFDQRKKSDPKDSPENYPNPPEQDLKREVKLTSTATIASNTRELIFQLSRGNTDPAHALARRVQADLNMILSSDLDAASILRQQARQTMFAIEEVLALVDQSDLRGAWEAARDAAKEWRAIAQSQE